MHNVETLSPTYVPIHWHPGQETGRFLSEDSDQVCQALLQALRIDQ